MALSSLIPLSEPIEAVPQQSRMMNQYAGNEIWMKRLMIDAFTITRMFSILPIETCDDVIFFAQRCSKTVGKGEHAGMHFH